MSVIHTSSSSGTYGKKGPGLWPHWNSSSLLQGWVYIFVIHTFLRIKSPFTYICDYGDILYTDSISCSLYSWHSILHTNLHFIRFHHSLLARSLPSFVPTTLVHLLLGMKIFFVFWFHLLLTNHSNLSRRSTLSFEVRISQQSSLNLSFCNICILKTSGLDIIPQFWLPFQDFDF